MTSNPIDDRIFTERPRIALLGEEHWSDIQRRYRMSPRELQVAKLVCQGFSNDEIATDLKMKKGTVKTHIRNIYRRIQVSSKITMLLKFVDNAIKLSTERGVSLTIPIVSVKKTYEKTSPPLDASSKE